MENTLNPSIHFTFNKPKWKKYEKNEKKKNTLTHHPDGEKEMIAN
jgi:hypothetical protein